MHLISLINKNKFKNSHLIFSIIFFYALYHKAKYHNKYLTNYLPYL